MTAIATTSAAWIVKVGGWPEKSTTPQASPTPSPREYISIQVYKAGEELETRIEKIFATENSIKRDKLYWINQRNSFEIDERIVACTPSGVVYKFHKKGCVVHHELKPLFIGILVDPVVTTDYINNPTHLFMLGDFAPAPQVFEACPRFKKWIQKMGMVTY
jgi:hypothetical protein